MYDTPGPTFRWDTLQDTTRLQQTPSCNFKHTAWFKRLNTRVQMVSCIYKTFSIDAPLHWQHKRMRPSHSWWTRLNTSGVSPAHVSLMCSLRCSIFCFFIWITMNFKCPPQLKVKWGWGLETSKATARYHGDQPNDLKTADLPTGARIHYTQWKDTFESPLY